MRLRRTCDEQMRKVLFAGHDLAGLLDPVFAEGSLQPVDDRTFDAQAGVAPVILILPMPRPLLGQTKSTDVADAAVDDRFLAMIAVVETSEVGERGAVETDELHTRVEHQRAQLLVHLVAA